jgi:hypothetical protein
MQLTCIESKSTYRGVAQCQTPCKPAQAKDNANRLLKTGFREFVHVRKVEGDSGLD